MPDPKPDSLKLGSGMVERACGVPIDAGTRHLDPEDARAALTAALRLDDPEVVERVARWLIANVGAGEWDKLDDEAQMDYFRAKVPYMVAALLSEGEPE